MLLYLLWQFIYNRNSQQLKQCVYDIKYLLYTYMGELDWRNQFPEVEDRLAK